MRTKIPTIERSDDESWKEQGACVGKEPLWWANEDPRAKIICLRDCPVREQCLNFSLQIVGPKVPGIWGGTTFMERNPNSTPPGVVRGAGGRFLPKA